MNIIVVDDEPVIAHTLVEILNGEGHKALAVLNGASAITAARSISPDAVIIDVVMPEMDGIETAKGHPRSSTRLQDHTVLGTGGELRASG